MDALATGDPARIGPFRLVARLGRGGMGRVYLGRAESTGRAVAVKTVHGELLADAEFRARFAHEVAAARRVRDEYIAEVVDADPDAATPWLATAYVPGISVEDAVRRFGPLPADSVRILGVCVARAVSAIHAVGLVHRDLKPGNVLLTAAGPKVIDFGIARGVSEAGLTRTGMVSGSPPYMAPEQLAQGAFGPGSDVFSIGAILHYAATAAGPYGRGGAQEQYARALAVGPLADPALPDGLVELVNRCFVTDPNSRPAAADMARMLEAHAGERPGPGWLPSAVIGDILAQATDALNKDSAGGGIPTPQAQAQAWAQAQPQTPPQASAQAQAPSQARSPAPPRYQVPQQSPQQAQAHQMPPRQPQPQSRPQQHPQSPQYRPPGQSGPSSAPSQPSHAQAQAQPPLVPPPVQSGAQTPRPFAPPNQPPQNTPPAFARPGGPPQPPYGQYPNTPRPNGSFPNAQQFAGYRPQHQPVPPMAPLPYGYRQAPPNNSMAVTALVLALVGIIVPCLLPVALPFGFAGLSRAKRNGVGHGQAMAGVIVSSVLIALWVLLIVAIANNSNGS